MENFRPGKILDKLETIVDCKHSGPFVNEHYSYVQGIILFHR